MIPLKIRRVDGSTRRVDLGALVRVAKGTSQINSGCKATLTFSPELDAFIELSSAEQDVRGNAEGHSNEVTDEYAERVYGAHRGQVPV
jgi:hypothetical protein